MKLWGGRFAKSTDSVVEDFHSSISFDARLYKQDITGSLAHAQMLADCAIITQDEADQIKRGLLLVLEDIENGRCRFEVEAEDIHMNIEKLLTEKIGGLGKKLHTARSRNDQVAVDTRLWFKAEVAEIFDLLKALEQEIIALAKQHDKTIMPGYTHLQRAQPISFAHHLLAYFNMFARDLERLADCRRRADFSPLGSCALAGTTLPINREQTAKDLGFSGYTANSLDGVSDRDFAIEFCADASIIMMHLSRFCEEIILWSSSEFAFVSLDDAYSTGSSIMPQKKNPDVAELVRGKTGRVYGALITLLTVMKSLPLAYNKDMQEDKEPLFDAVDTVKGCLTVFTPMLASLKINKDKMRAAVGSGFLNATDLADYLAAKGLPFREAHAVSGRLVLYCEQKGKALDDLSLDELKRESELFEQDIYQAISVDTCLAARTSAGGPAPEAVKKAVKEAEAKLAKLSL
mgnify:FL=1